MKKNTLLQVLVAASISAVAVPAFVQGQTSGGSAGSGSSMSSGSGGSGSMGSGSSGSSSMGSSSRSDTGSMGSSSSSGMSGAPGAAGGSTTAMTDHGASEADRSLNQNLRQTLAADSSLKSSTGNVHFNTDNGKVTLNGTVATEKEKKDIENRVEKMSGVKSVDNQLQIAPQTSSASGSSSMGSSNTLAGSESSAASRGSR